MIRYKRSAVCKAVNLKYIREISSQWYKMKNYNDKAKCKAEDWGYERIRKHLIVNLKKYNIQ